LKNALALIEIHQAVTWVAKKCSSTTNTDIAFGLSKYQNRKNCVASLQEITSRIVSVREFRLEKLKSGKHPIAYAKYPTSIFGEIAQPDDRYMAVPVSVV
jgi:hypothetical protein